MSVHTAIEARSVHPSAPDRLARLPLRAELFLLAHDDDTGAPHINEQSLAVGLAGAVLLELWLAGRVVVGWTFNPRTGRWEQTPGRLTPYNTDPVGDPLADAAMAAIEQTQSRSHNQLRMWLRGFAATDLYERVRANMVAVAVLRQSVRRRLLVKSDVYTAADPAWAVRARGQLRAVVHRFEHPHRLGGEAPDDQCAGLCGLAHVLELAPFLYLDLPNPRLRHWLGHVAANHNPTIGEVIAAVDAGRGDLAVAAMR
jgi:hypothetical protein